MIARRRVEFSGEGIWRGLHRNTLIDYSHGQPRIRSLVPPNETERQAVSAELQANTMDILSALAELMRQRCSHRQLRWHRSYL